MHPKKYELIEHAADLGIRVYGKDAGALFENAAYALFDLITDVSSLKDQMHQSITITGMDWPDLMVNWLRELLFLWNGKEQLVRSAKIHTLTEKQITADILYAEFKPSRHEIKLEIKAVTHHMASVVKKTSRWEAQIIFDV